MNTTENQEKVQNKPFMLAFFTPLLMDSPKWISLFQIDPLIYCSGVKLTVFVIQICEGNGEFSRKTVINLFS